MAQYGFGSGVVFGVPLTNAAGIPVPNATPQRFGILQDVSVDFSFTNKELRGQYQYPVAVGRGPAKAQGKAKFGQFNGELINGLFFGQTLSAGQSLIADKEALTVTTGSATVTNASTFADDLGVIYAATGLPLTRISSAPTVGQYSVTPAGVYTFDSADTGAITGNLLASYRYSSVTPGTATSIAVTNQLMGYAPTFRVELYVPYAGRQMVLVLNACIGSKLNFATKIEDFLIPEFDFDAFADAAGNVYSFNFSE